MRTYQIRRTNVYVCTMCQCPLMRQYYTICTHSIVLCVMEVEMVYSSCTQADMHMDIHVNIYLNVPRDAALQGSIPQRCSAAPETIHTQTHTNTKHKFNQYTNDKTFTHTNTHTSMQTMNDTKKRSKFCVLATEPGEKCQM